MEDVKIVISHPKGLGQCSKNIHRYFPSAQQVAAESTAAAVVMMLESDMPAVAIAGRTAAQEGAVILQEQFQDVPTNETRFWVVGQSCPEPTGHDQTSLAFELFKNVPGALMPVYALFAARGINLSKLESRPTKEAIGEVVFLADVDGHQKDPVLKEALEYVKVCTPKLRVFGSYPRENGA